MKTLDTDISNLIKHSKSLNHRAIILLTGDNAIKGIGVVCNFIEKLGTKSILYCYVKDNKKRKLESNGKKRKTVCHNVQLYLQKHCSSEIRWCLYKETQNILGKTFDICIFQDYKNLTPNIIARGMETVSGGGLVIFLAPAFNKLEAYLNTSFNSGLHKICNAQRFLKRFTISLLASKFCVCLDEEFNLLNKKKKAVKYVEKKSQKNNRDLVLLKESLKIADSAFFPMVNICATYDQAKCLRSLCSSIRMFHNPSNKDDNDARYAVTVLVTAARGRGKSAALGLALCAALEAGMSQICVTALSPDNISTLWQYVKLGLKALNYSEHIDFQITTSYLSDGVKAITKVELKKSKFTQVIRYITPSETESPDCDLLCIDEAAAIPSIILHSYLRLFQGLVFVSSTVCGYEGSGMMLSTNLFQDLRQSFTVVNPNNESQPVRIGTKGRLYEITLEEPIRYGNNDPVESFLIKSLCMNYKAAEYTQAIDDNLIVDKCQLVVLNRDVLFDANKISEIVLQRIMSVYCASNPQNSPDDLKQLADDECSRLLILTSSPIDNENPTVLVVLQIVYEGEVNREYVSETVRTLGVSPIVDIMSNILMDEFLEPKFKHLSGVRIQVIATTPNLLNRGLASRALKLLMDHICSSSPCSTKKIKNSKSLLLPLSALPNVNLNYVGVYTILNARLIKFFQRISDFNAVYVDHELNEITGDCKGILLKRINSEISPDNVYSFNWMALFRKIFMKRFSLLRYGYLKEFSDEFKILLEKTMNPEIEKDFNGLPNENIRTFSVY